MKTFSFSRMVRFALSAVVLAGFVACSTPIERRIASNRQIYEKLSPEDKELVARGRIREGMTKEAVFLAWGRPDHVTEGRQKGVSTDRWTYMSAQPVYTENYSYGGWGGGWGGRHRGWGGYGWGYGGPWDPYWGGGYGGYGTSVTYLPYKAATVDFRNNVVQSYMRGRQ